MSYPREARPGDLVVVSTPEDLERQLRRAHAEQNFPLVALVNPANSLFSAFVSGTPDAWHVVNLMGAYQTPNVSTAQSPVVVELCNQWGHASKYLGANALPLRTIWDAMQ
jgi:hypothetical protein